MAYEHVYFNRCVNVKDFWREHDMNYRINAAVNHGNSRREKERKYDGVNNE